MNDSDVQEATVTHNHHLSAIWIIPLIALSIGIWMLYYQWANQGPSITIEFSIASGIEAGKTKIRTRDVEIGVVKSVELKPDLTGVTVTARITPSAANLLTDASNFWIVRPRVSLSGISGLNTLLSGPYINMEPVKQGAPSNQFIALENPPATKSGTPGLRITLNSDAEFAYKSGDPIIYKGLKVGEFEDIKFDLEERVVYYNAFVEAPYHKLITQNTKFWNVSGINFELAASGFKVRTGSVETLLTNGVTFGVPEGLTMGDVIADDAHFDIYTDYEAASNERFKLGVNFVILIKDTVRGLTIGAPVEYRGLVIGKVLDINFASPESDEVVNGAIEIPVLITIQPSRFEKSDDANGLNHVNKQILHWIKQGLSASLKTGNIITGGLYVDLQHYDDIAVSDTHTFQGYDVIPTTTGEFAQITEKVNQILDNINGIPLASLTNDTQQLLVNAQNTARSIEEASTTLNILLTQLQEDGTSKNVNNTLVRVDKLLSEFSTGSQINDEFTLIMQRLQDTLGQLTPLLQQLNKSPNSLIFENGSHEQNIEPKASNKQDISEK